MTNFILLKITQGNFDHPDFVCDALKIRKTLLKLTRYVSMGVFVCACILFQVWSIPSTRSKIKFNYFACKCICQKTYWKYKPHRKQPSLSLNSLFLLLSFATRTTQSISWYCKFRSGMRRKKTTDDTNWKWLLLLACMVGSDLYANKPKWVSWSRYVFLFVAIDNSSLFTHRTPDGSV